MQHSKFTDIGQFRDAIRNIKHAAQFVGVAENGELIMDRQAEMPTVSFHGTIKLHGTNAGVAQDKDGNIWYLGRKQVVTVEKDNAGFAFFAESHKENFIPFFQAIRENNDIVDETVIFYGEWCGKGIQKGIAITELPKMFMIFAVKVVPEEGENYYLTRDKYCDFQDPVNRIFNIHQFPSFDIDIDFSNPAEAQNQLTDLTLEVEKECPVGKAFGINGIGEGIVWEGHYKNNRYIFKTKGEKHSSSKVKKIVHVDPEKVNSIKEFVEYTVTENRLNQAIEQVFTCNAIEPSRKGTGDFLRWIVQDIHKEEMDTMVENNLEPKDVNGKLSEKARNWFFTKLDQGLGLDG